jgi:hypothetical protein
MRSSILITFKYFTEMTDTTSSSFNSPPKIPGLEARGFDPDYLDQKAHVIGHFLFS